MATDDALLGIRQVLLGARDDLLARPNVVATGVGFKEVDGRRTSELSIVCSVTQKVPIARLAPGDLVPRAVVGVPTDVVPTGAFRALAEQAQRVRPAPGGVSIGHKDITAGTLGCLVRRDGQVFILSNNHVLANANLASVGDAILQPGPYDGGRMPADLIATLEDFVPIVVGEQESGCAFARGTARFLSDAARLVGSDARLRAVTVKAGENRVDAAIGRPVSADAVTSSILGVGAPTGVTEAQLGMAVRKSGRSTGLTSGEILQIDVTADVDYDGKTARFTDQVMAGAMSQGGDSGSAIVDVQGRIVGLLFAGSDSTTLANRIEVVFEALRLELER
ncbi:MAG TPA: trypsin-like peptidase domain-containing protein [Coriobacteriia bacterium]